MITQHTPGPWKVVEDGMDWHVHAVNLPFATGDYYAICERVNGDSTEGAIYTPKANAHLIAAAPAMLEALQILVAAKDAGELPEHPCEFDWAHVEQAIAEATGNVG